MTSIHFSCFRLVLLFYDDIFCVLGQSAILVGKRQQEWAKLEQVGDIAYYLLTSLQTSARDDMKTWQSLTKLLDIMTLTVRKGLVQNLCQVMVDLPHIFHFDS